MNNFRAIFSNRISWLMKAVLVISIVSSFNLACRAMDDQTISALEGQRWTLEEINGQTALAKSPNDGMGELGKPYLEFDLTKNNFSGMVSCNLITGKVQVNGNNLKLAQETSTAMACREPLMNQERDVLELLPQINRFEQSEQILLFYVDERLVLKFKKVASDTNLTVKSGCATALFNNQNKQDLKKQIPTDLKSENVKWVLTAIGRRQLEKRKPETFIFFDKNWSFSGNSYCHSFGGGYKTGGDSISFDAYETPHRLQTECLKQGYADQMEFFESLRKVNRFEIKDEQLSLYADKKLLLTFEARKNRKGDK